MRGLEENRSGGALCGVAKAMSSVEQQGNGTATICGALQRLSAAKQRQGNVRESEHCSGNVRLRIAAFCYGMAWHSSGGAWRRNDLRSIAKALYGETLQRRRMASMARQRLCMDLPGKGKA